MEEQKPISVEDEWETVEPNVWKPEAPGDTIVGVLVQKRTDVGSNNSMLYYLDCPEGVRMVWGSTVLDDRMTVIELGEKIRINFKGTEKNKRGQDTKIFTVDRAKVRPVA